MAKCRRCGASYDYKKTEGVCPKCAYYNRPVQQEWEDNSWLRNYNVDDNSYIPPKVSWDAEDYASKGRDSKGRKKGCDQEGSHVHTSKKAASGKKEKKKKRHLFRWIILLIILANILRPILSEVMGDAFYFIMETIDEFTSSEEKTDDVSDIPDDKDDVETSYTAVTIDEAKEGFVAGDVSYRINDVKVYDASQFPSCIPKGEKILAVDVVMQNLGEKKIENIFQFVPFLIAKFDYVPWCDMDTVENIKEQLGDEITKQGIFTESDNGQGYVFFLIKEDIKTVELYFSDNKLNDQDEYEITGNYTYVPFDLP